MTLGEKIHHLRKLNGMSQEELALHITVSRQAISKWELGESIPDTGNVIQLCKLFHVSADFLLYDDVESDTDIPVVRENSEKLKRKYTLILLYVIMGLFIVILVILIILGLKYRFKYLTVIIGVLFIVFFGSGILVVKLPRKYHTKKR